MRALFALLLVAALGSAALAASGTWWAVFRWIPEDEPPARVLTGPFPSYLECHRWAAGFVRPGLVFVDCVEIQRGVIP